jgi:hypothetical protein
MYEPYEWIAAIDGVAVVWALIGEKVAPLCVVWWNVSVRALDVWVRALWGEGGENGALTGEEKCDL